MDALLQDLVDTSSTTADESSTPPRTLRIIRRAAECPDPILHGLIDGVDNDTDAVEEQGAPVPFWVIDSLDDLDRAMAGLSSDELWEQMQIERWVLAKAKTLARKARLLSRYAHLVPAPAADKNWKVSKGLYTGGAYRNQPERAADYKLIDREAASAVGLLREVTTMQAVPAGQLKDWQKQNGGMTPPGYEVSTPPAVSFSAAKDGKE